MNEKQLQVQRDRLTAMAERLTAEVSGLRDEALRGTGGEPSGNLSNAPMHLADLSADNYQQEVATGLLQNEQAILVEIRAALDRLDAGTYGRCEDCGKEMPKGRLDALPYARRCVACEERAEQRDDESGALAGLREGQGGLVRPGQLSPPTPARAVPLQAANTGNESIPPGARRQAEERAVTPSSGPNENAQPGRTIDRPDRGEKAR